jgi:tryptophan synthase alpha subunit
MTILNNAIQEANAQGRLALVLYTIPNFPDPTTYQEILALLHENPYVTIIETTFPVTSQFSEFANPVIQNAHHQAAQFHNDLAVMETLQPFRKPTICVLYRETFNKLGYETILKKIQGKIDGLLFEWIVPDIEAYTYSFDQYGIEVVQCAEPSMTDQELAHYLSLAVEEPLVYLVSAPMTGAKIFSKEQIISCVQTSKRYKPKAKLVAGFGISTADDIIRLSHIEGLHGVIIGTAFLKVMQQGTRQAALFLDQITQALSETSIHPQQKGEIS